MYLIVFFHCSSFELVVPDGFPLTNSSGLSRHPRTRPMSAQGAVHEGSGSLATRLRGWRLEEPLVTQGTGDVSSRLAPAPRDTLLTLHREDMLLGDWACAHVRLRHHAIGCLCMCGR